jgi:DNA-directed RNA polymerase subunit RPC12/RpoP
MYKCSECGKEVIVLEGEVIKACECEAPIIAEAEASMNGAGGLVN